MVRLKCTKSRVAEGVEVEASNCKEVMSQPKPQPQNEVLTHILPALAAMQ